MSNYEDRRKEEREYYADVYYDVWRAGGNPDRLEDDRVSNHHDNGLFHDEAARAEMRRWQHQREEREQEQSPEEEQDL